jgi:hypothetical protein
MVRKVPWDDPAAAAAAEDKDRAASRLSVRLERGFKAASPLRGGGCCCAPPPPWASRRCSGLFKDGTATGFGCSLNAAPTSSDTTRRAFWNREVPMMDSREVVLFVWFAFCACFEGEVPAESNLSVEKDNDLEASKLSLSRRSEINS